MDNASQSHGLPEVIISVASVILGLITFLYIIPAQVMDPNPSIPNAKTFPYLISGIFTLLCCRWVFNAIGEFRKTRHASSPAVLFIGLGIGAFILLIAFLIGSVGYLVGGVLAAFVVIVAIDGIDRWLMALLAGVAITVGFAFFFGKLLHIEIPVGLLSLF